MVAMNPRPPSAEMMDHVLNVALCEWSSVPVLVEEWPTWDDLSQLDFVVEWPVREDRLVRLQQWAKEGRFTPQQQEQYRHLLEMVERHRPVVERLLAEKP